LARAQRAKVTADISAISSALDQFAIDNAGKYPQSLEVLVAPDVNGSSFLDRSRVPLDPWKNPYGYEPPTPGRTHPRVYSLGKDGQPGGDGENQDIDDAMVRDGLADSR